MVKFTNDPGAIDESDLCADPDRASKMRGFLSDLKDYLGEGHFTIRQEDFLEDMLERLESQGPAATFTDKQYGWAKGLWEQLK